MRPKYKYETWLGYNLTIYLESLNRNELERRKGFSYLSMCTGVLASKLKKWSYSENIPRIDDDLRKLARFLKVSVDQLCYGSCAAKFGLSHKKKNLENTIQLDLFKRLG